MLPATERDSDILVYCQFIDKDLDGDEPWYSCKNVQAVNSTVKLVSV